MLATPKDILTQFPVRKTKAQKKAFRDAVQSYAQSQGYPSTIEIGSFDSQNLVIGDSKQAPFLLVAGTADSAVITVLEILRTLPENRRSRVCMLFCDSPLFGMRSYCRNHRQELKSQLVLEMDEIGTGDRIRFFPTKQLLGNRRKLTSLYKACGYFGKKNLLVYEEKALAQWKVVPYGVKICTIQNGKKESWKSRTPTNPNTTPDETNINILRAALTTYICCDAAQ